MRYELDAIRKQMNTELSKDTFLGTFYESIEGILRVVHAILHTKGEKWVDHVVDATGKALLTAEEKEEFKRKADPFIQPILLFFHPTMHGGSDDMSEEEKQMEELSQSLIQSRTLPVPSVNANTGPSPQWGPDNLYELFLSYVDGANRAMKGLSQQYGTLKLENDALLRPDVKIIPGPLREALGTLASAPPIAKFLAPTVLNPIEQSAEAKKKTVQALRQITTPPLMIPFLIDLALDMARIMAHMSGAEERRKTLSVIMSLRELVNGEWKKAILSFMGYYGPNAFMLGELGRVYIMLFTKLSPTIQNKIVYGALDTTKSFLIGILLTIFKVTAPDSIRLKWIEQFDKMALIKQAIDGNLKEQGLPPRDDHYTPSFADLENMQSLMDDPQYICSTQFVEFLRKTLGIDVLQEDGTKGIQPTETATMTIIFQLLRIPTTKEAWNSKCKEPKDFLQGILEDQTQKKEVQERIRALQKQFEPAAVAAAAVEPVAAAAVEPVVVEPSAPLEPSVEPTAEPSAPLEPSVEPVAVVEPSAPLEPTVKSA